MTFEETLTFDDVLLKPKYSEIQSRSQVDLSVELCKGFKFGMPIIPANMSDIINQNMIEKIYSHKGLSLMHRFCSLEEQLSIFHNLQNKYGPYIFNYVGASIGVKDYDYSAIEELVNVGIKIFCVDVAHLDSTLGLAMVKYLANRYDSKDNLIIAGNVATGEAAGRAWGAGADVVKVGIGASGICSTRLEAAAGVPQLSAVRDVYNYKLEAQRILNRPLYFISDGGHKTTADCVKSLCFADMIMLGGMLSGTNECSGTKVQHNGKDYISYNGSSTHKKDRIEGVKGLVKPKGPVDLVIKKICEGIQSGCSYQNSKSLQQLKQSPTFVKISSAGIAESKIHGVYLSDE